MPTCSRQTLVKGHAFLVKPAYYLKSLYGVRGFCVCPDCDSTHEHTPYEEAGTNEKGVMVSATESLYGTDAVLSVDPYVDNGIEEAEITTVLLSEASTAREGVALLTSIYDNAGAAGGSGVFIADQNETWFVENLTGHTYLALKLSSSVVFILPIPPLDGAQIGLALREALRQRNQGLQFPRKSGKIKRMKKCSVNGGT